MVTAMYVVGGPGDREDLRYSLRSLVNAPVIDEVWCVGDVPAWFAGGKLRLEPHPDKFANQRQSITRFVNAPGAPESFYLFNDDMFIVEPIDGHLPVCRNRNMLEGWLGVEVGGRRPNAWHRAVQATAEWAQRQYGYATPIYETHTPLLFDTARLRDLVNAYPVDEPFAVGELYPLAGVGGVGEHHGNAKCKAGDSLAERLAQHMPYLSCSPDTWDGEVGEYTRGLFPDPCVWEREAIGVAA